MKVDRRGVKIMLALLLAELTLRIACQNQEFYGQKKGQLLPSSNFVQAVQVCMRIITDATHGEYDRETASDLCLGRLTRLKNIVMEMQHVQSACKDYPSEDLKYLLALIHIIANKRAHDFAYNQYALAQMHTIKMSLFYML